MKTFSCPALITKLVKCEWLLNDKGNFPLVSNLSNLLYLAFERNGKCLSLIRRVLYFFTGISLHRNALFIAQPQYLTFFPFPPLTNFLIISDSSFAWPSNLKQTVEKNKSLVIIFLTTQTLNNQSLHLYLYPFSLLTQSRS